MLYIQTSEEMINAASLHDISFPVQWACEPDFCPALDSFSYIWGWHTEKQGITENEIR